jgi:hypothetical protein
MAIIDQLASALGDRSEILNIDLAKNIAKKKDKKAVAELIAGLSHKSKNIQNDCIKVLYEIGEIDPSLLTPYAKDFILLLSHTNNRLQWGAMSAISTITAANPKLIYAALPKIIDAANKGSVITKDNAVSILIQLCAIKEYAAGAFSLLLEQLNTSFPNQLPMYAERAMGIVSDKNKPAFIKLLRSRLADIEKDTKRVRVEKVIKKLS